MRTLVHQLAGVAIALLLFTACSAGPGATCDSIAAPPYMNSPANGATGVNPNIGSLKLDGPLLTVTMVNAGGQNIAIGTPVLVNGDWIVSVPTLAASTTYTLSATYQGSCGGGTIHATLGSFTTAS